jgi:CheY-like chemotaxis protein
MAPGLYDWQHALQPMIAVKSVRVMIVDDNADHVDTLAALVNLEGHTAHGIYTAVDIVNEVKRFKPDVVVLDIAMPGRDGWAAATAIRTAFPGPRPVLIACSGEYTRNEHVRLAKARGFNHYVMKPCDTGALLQLIESA